MVLETGERSQLARMQFVAQVALPSLPGVNRLEQVGSRGDIITGVEA